MGTFDGHRGQPPAPHAAQRPFTATGLGQGEWGPARVPGCEDRDTVNTDRPSPAFPSTPGRLRSGKGGL